MSMIGSLLAFAIGPLKARLRPTRDFALDYWRDAYYALADENERLRRERGMLAAQAEMLAVQNRSLGLERDALREQLERFNQVVAPSPHLGQHQQALAQPSAQAFQEAQLAGYQGLCNCVPARSDLFKGPRL